MKSDHPAAIHNDSTRDRYTILHSYRVLDMKTKGGGIALISRESLRAHPIGLVGKIMSFEVFVVKTTARTGFLNFFTIYRRPQTARFFNEFCSLLDEVISNYPCWEDFSSAETSIAGICVWLGESSGHTGPG